MRQKQQGGFTLIEVTLFLAISGLLLLIAVFGMGPQLKQSEFTDSMQSIGSYINSQYNDIQTGVNNRKTDISCSHASGSDTVTVSATGGGDAGTGASCVLLGRYFQFTATGITAKDVVGAVDGKCSTPSTDKLVAKLEKACATNVTGSNNSAQDYTFSWGNAPHNIPPGRVLKGTTTDFNSAASSEYYSANGFGIYRDPDSGQIFTVLYQQGSIDGHLAQVALHTDNINAQFCFTGQVSYPGAIYFGGNYQNDSDAVSGGHNLVSVKVDDSSCNNWKVGVPL